jgi:hypothetical protein
MAHEQVVFELERDGRRVYCSSFAVVVALLEMGWTFGNWGEWAKFVNDVTTGPSTRPVTLGSPSVEQAD